MGEAKLKQRRRQQFLQEHPFCCFCGGATPATERDHVPSRQMFTFRARPRGLEVPACKRCNESTRQHEQVAALLGRIYRDGERSLEEQEELLDIMIKVRNNNPAILMEMAPSLHQEQWYERAKPSLPPGVVPSRSGPLVDKTLQIVGSKLGFALHYATTRRIVPLSGGVAVRWISNYQALTGAIPGEIYKALGPRHTLRQGKWLVEEQFSYASWTDDAASIAAYYSVFRLSFAVVSLVSEDVANFAAIERTRIHRPGAFYS